ncbi:hypothetical protein [Gimesia algae]|uniref:Uncharacterized protein n=1 Tax=Gimesia algae TaxID=2527971 RepID=A0A517VBR8_9PLAN|nr:hypothetical protein [Gimesia algae]QDT90453.1 hypothetical protein Pan161_21050 [Gimesia algae]
MKIHVTIERLILDGLPVNQDSAPLIKETVQAELSRLFTENSTSQNLTSGGAVSSLRTAPIHLDAHSSPDAVGKKIATAMHGDLSR